jgi:hypothetical protein
MIIVVIICHICVEVYLRIGLPLTGSNEGLIDIEEDSPLLELGTQVVGPNS